MFQPLKLTSFVLKAGGLPIPVNRIYQLFSCCNGKIRDRKNMRHYLIQILVLLLPCGIILANRQVPPRSSKAAVVGTNVTLVCNISGVDLTIWMFKNNHQISQGLSIFTSNQYGLEVRNDGMQIALTVIIADEDDEGLYSCQNKGDLVMEFDLTVEVPPILQLEFGNSIYTSNSTLSVTFTEEAVVQCIARGSKPLVSLMWEVDGREATGGVTTNNSREDERITISTLRYLPNVGDETLTCITGGQQAVPSEIVRANINVMYAPKCSLLVSNETTNEFRLFCRCEANPPPNNYGIYVNGSLQSTEREVFISSQSPAVVFCNASNIIGDDTTDPVELGEFNVDQPLSGGIIALIVCLLILFILTIASMIIIRQHQKAKKQKDAIARTRATIEAGAIHLLSEQKGNIEDKSAPSNLPLIDQSSQKAEPSEQNKENTEDMSAPSKVPLMDPSSQRDVPSEQDKDNFQDLTNPGEGEKWKEEHGGDDDEEL